jgi:hypothetical protein
MRPGGSKKLDRITMQTTIRKTIADAEHDGERTTEERAGMHGERTTLPRNNRSKFNQLSIATGQFESLL